MLEENTAANIEHYHKYQKRNNLKSKFYCRESKFHLDICHFLIVNSDFGVAGFSLIFRENLLVNLMVYEGTQVHLQFLEDY